MNSLFLKKEGDKFRSELPKPDIHNFFNDVWTVTDEEVQEGGPHYGEVFDTYGVILYNPTSEAIEAAKLALLSSIADPTGLALVRRPLTTGWEGDNIKISIKLRVAAMFKTVLLDNGTSSGAYSGT